MLHRDKILKSTRFFFQILTEQEVSSEAAAPIIQPEESEKREIESSEDAEDSLEPATKKFKPDDQPEAVATAVVWKPSRTKTLMTWKSSADTLKI